MTTKALDFETLAKHSKVNGLHQAPNIPQDTGSAIQYAGSPTGWLQWTRFAFPSDLERASTSGESEYRDGW